MLLQRGVLGVLTVLLSCCSEAYSVYFEQSSSDDYAILSRLTRCFKLFHSDGHGPRGLHKAMLRYVSLTIRSCAGASSGGLTGGKGTWGKTTEYIFSAADSRSLSCMHFLLCHSNGNTHIQSATVVAAPTLASCVRCTGTDAW